MNISAPSDVFTLLFQDMPYCKLLGLRQTCKLFRRAVTPIIRGRFPENLLREDFDQIKEILAKYKDKVTYIHSIKNPKLQLTFALVHASATYVLWDKNILQDAHNIQANMIAVNDFLVNRKRFMDTIKGWENERVLSELLMRKAEAVQIKINLSYSEWVTQPQLSTIGKIYSQTPGYAVPITDNDRFYFAFYYMFIDKSCQSEGAISHLITNANNGHTFSQWVLGEYYFHNNVDLKNTGLEWMRGAANSNDPFFTHRFAVLLTGRNKEFYMTEITQLLEKAMKANYPLAFYDAALLCKDGFFPGRNPTLLLQESAKLGCAEAKLHLQKQDRNESGCNVQ